MAAHRPATLADVARVAGVSRSTASRVIAGTGFASPTARERVRAAADRLGYVPNSAARALVHGTGVRLLVAVVGASPAVLDDSYVDQAVAAMARVCAPYGLGVTVQWVPLDVPDELTRLTDDRGVAGLIMLNTTTALLDLVPRRLRGRSVSIGIGSAAVPSVDIDNGGGTAAIVRHLYAVGRRRIAMVTGPRWLACAHRSVEAYRGLLRDAGLPAREVTGDFSAARGRAAAREVLRRWPDTDAIVGISDATALGVIGQLRADGVRVPDDVAVTGFDDIPLASAVALTTASHPVRRIATAAATTVLEHRPAPAATLFPSALVLRDSA
ncbi:LacI family DNA-binding transcriptional regulator [Micromonospora sp. WMMD1082]|uniref:LacI family DNA-binding transcriptional regulator n=1 Tax=Micromonospora sp. WMMD1082 TaxID=3016104 RepID=UPI002417D767|nr:LacI family DNA-binding transcriptional regulator [Micromonospora sp. WMMD1082]MDG4797238.1 LacI family DNA-binding transcriptional regulator [Micromonospora sp. WMMD1082]